MEDNRRGGNGRRDGRREYGDRRNHSNNGERRSFGNNSERRSYGSDRPRRSFSEDGERRSSFGGGERRSFSNDRPRRSFSEGGERKSYGNSERRSFGSDRPRRSFSEGGERRSSFGGERRSFGDRKPFSGERKSFGDRKPGGFRNSAKKSFNRNDFNYFRDENESGINKMISRRPQVENEALSDNDMVKAPIKEEVRLNKFIANSGVCSRREADNFILAGVVTVNGEVVTELGTKVNITTDDIRFNGERLKGEEKIYIVMNKPKGYVTTASDPHADKTVMDLLKGCPSRVFPVGRLDKNTTGVLMFTNDGEIAEKLTHPSYDKKKIYQVSLDSKL